MSGFSASAFRVLPELATRVKASTCGVADHSVKVVDKAQYALTGAMLGLEDVEIEANPTADSFAIRP